MRRSFLTPNQLLDSDFQTVREAYKDYMLLINCAESTINAYLSNFRLYHDWCVRQNVQDIYDQMQVREYLLYRVGQGAKWQTMNNIYSAMRKLFREVLEVDWSFKKLPRPKKERTLPQLISKSEVGKLIKGCQHNLKHQTIVITLYATGMRAGELRNLKITDIDSDRLQIRIRKGKGAKDRYIQIPSVLIEVLRKYFKKYRPEGYLFNGRKRGSQISLSAMRWVIRKSTDRMKIKRKVSPHTLRHCYATHHLESGTDLVYLQKNLGHKHLKTTARYIHLCNRRYQHIHHPIVDIITDSNQKTTE